MPIEPCHQYSYRGAAASPRFGVSGACSGGVLNWDFLLRKTFEIAAGIILVILGLIGGLIPVLQGWVFGIPGLILLAKHFKWARRLLDWAKSKVQGGPSAGGTQDKSS